MLLPHSSLVQEHTAKKESPFLAQELEFPEPDEGYTDEPAQEPLKPPRPPPGVEGDLPDRRRHRQPLPPWTRGNIKVAPQFRQQMWKLMSKRAQMRTAVRKIAKPP